MIKKMEFAPLVLRHRLLLRRDSPELGTLFRPNRLHYKHLPWMEGKMACLVQGVFRSAVRTSF